MGSASIFAGSKVKTLKSTLSLNGQSDIISQDINPQTSAVDAKAGSLLLNPTSGTIYRKLDAGSTTNWVEVGAGTGGKNYIKNPDFDGGATTSWSMQKVSLSSFIPTGNIGAADAGHTIATSGSSPLEGANSLLVQGASAFTAGNCLVSKEFTIDREDVAKVMGWSFAYEAITTNMDFSGTTGNTWAVYIAEVTTGTPNTVVSWIQPAGVYNLVQGSGVGLASGTFQTTATESSAYRIVLVCINSEAAATTLKVDDFQLGPQRVVYGSPVTDWQTFTPTPTGFTASAIEGKWRRVGDSIEVRVRAVMSATVGGAYSVSAPFPADSTKFPSGSVNSFYGTGGYIDVSVNQGYIGTSFITSGSSPVIGVYGPAGNQWQAAGFPVAFGAGDILTFEITYPAAGLSSSVSMSQDTDTRVVAFAGSFIGTSISTGTLDTAKIIVPGVSQDTHGAYSSGVGTYTVPVSGFYKITHENSMTLDVSRILRVGYTVNSTTSFTKLSIITNTSASFAITAHTTCTGIEKLNAGDVIRFAVAHDNASATSLTNDGRFQVYAIERLSGPATIAASETVACVYSSNSGQTINNTATTVVYEDKDFDTHGAYNSSTGIFTVPVSGKYLVAAGLYYNSSTNGVNFQAVQAGSVAKTYRLGEKPPSTPTSYQLNGSVEFNCAAGDTLKIQATASAGGSGLFALTELNYLTITRVGN